MFLNRPFTPSRAEGNSSPFFCFAPFKSGLARPLFFLALLAGSVGLLGESVKAEQPAQATLRVKRQFAWVGCGAKAMVFVNDKKLGDVVAGGELSFQFSPSATGVNNVYLQNSLAYHVFSPRKEFQVGPDGIATLECVFGFECITITGLRVDDPGEPIVSALQVWHDPNLTQRVLSQETIETPPGSKRTVKRSRHIEHSVSLTDTIGLEASLRTQAGIDVKALSIGIGFEIKGKLERSLNQTFKQSEIVEQAIEIDGNLLPKVKLVWVEKFRRGNAKMLINGMEKKVPFEFREAIELLCVPVQTTVER